MKEILGRARQLSRTVMAGLRRAVDPPLDADATPLDLGRAILEAIERRVQPAGHGRRVMPDNFVRVKVLAPDAAEERALRSVLDGLRDAAMARLREVQCEAPAGFRVDVGYVRSRPASWEPTQRIAIDFPVQRTAPEPPRPEVPVPILRITVVAGMATKTTYSFAGAVVRIGRSEAPVDTRGRVRRNDVAFLENDDERNRTVTRGHAEIRFDCRRGEFRVFDEGSANGTRVFRAGEAIEVPARDPIGVSLRSGDEIHFGTAAVRLTIGPRA